MDNPDHPEISLPELQETLLDDATLEQLFFDVKHAAELIGVSLKGASQERAAETSSGDPLQQAKDALREGRVMGVQLRYRHGGREWWDTLMRVQGGVRLVRIAPDLPG